MTIIGQVLVEFINIAAAMIGGAIAHTVLGGGVHIVNLAAIVAASNAGGAGSVVGDTMMPVEHLPPASWSASLGPGFLSAVFDNIPLTALAIKQGGYDWGFLAYAVGFGGSMIRFGSSGGVALSNLYPQARSVWQWLRHGRYVAACLRRRLLRDAGDHRMPPRFDSRGSTNAAVPQAAH
jgi:Na+/H+ antiporter NhaD/arsenite permease-like protein